jgi:16S rRNA (cytidine1402-2'-O)-methyltransferase
MAAAPLKEPLLYRIRLNGNLFIVSTPIGNLKDITLRALEILNFVDFIACEDTRVASILLNNYKIKKELTSLNPANEDKKKILIIGKMLNGENCALITDAGTPCISDPGAKLISEAIKNNITITSIPGPSAVISALSISGFPSSSFTFEGFLPKKKGRQKRLKELSEIENTIVLYESTYRIEKLLNELNEFIPNRHVVVCREMTKKFEEAWRGTPQQILSKSDKVIKGEFVVIISPKNWKIE